MWVGWRPVLRASRGCEAGDGILVIVPGDDFLADWCDRYLGARPVRLLFRSGHLSRVVGAELTDGRRVVIKARPADPRIAGCVAVQEHLARMGFPCPEPLAAPVQADGLTVTAEVLVPGGSQLSAEGGAAPFAALLARLVSCAPCPAAVPSLAPSPPWTGWDHPRALLWPDRDDRGRDLNSTPGPAWVDDAARCVRERLSASAAPALVGHGDWESQNVRWSGDRPLAVHDWDSVIAQPETAIVGLAAAVWPAAGATRRGRHRRPERGVHRQLSAGGRAAVGQAGGPRRLGGGPVGPPVQRQEGHSRRRRTAARPPRRRDRRPAGPGSPRNG
jgi:hypothetical protein